MKYVLFALFSSILMAGCMMRYPGSPAPVAAFKDKYADKLELGSTPVDWGYNYTFERLPDGHFLYKEFYSETRQLVGYETYQDQGRKVKDGPFKSWWDDGSPVLEGSYLNGEQTGNWTEWIYFGDRSDKSSGQYVMGKKEGLWVTLDAEGNKVSETNYAGGKRNGPFKNWNKDGQITVEGTYKDDKIETRKSFEAEDSEMISMSSRVEKRPSFPGCATTLSEEEYQKCQEMKMLHFIYTNIKYPPFAVENGIDGTAIVRFVVEKDGSVTSIKTMRSVSHDIKAECERVVGLMPKWNPGQMNGMPVRVQYYLPVKFKLE